MKSDVIDVSEGGLTAEYDSGGSPAFVAPVVDSRLVTVAAPLRTVACFRLDDARFGFDHSFLEPESSQEFAMLKTVVDDYPDAPLSVFGHADLTGRDDYNKKLSGRRAESVYAVLTRRVDMWERLVNEKHGNDIWGELQWQKMLVKLGRLAPPAGAKPTEASREAVKAFQSDHGLAVDGVIGPLTRAQLMSAYMDALCIDSEGNPYSVAPDKFLGKGKDSRGKGDYQGCGEFNPVVVMSEDRHAELDQSKNKLQRDNAEAPNRRILVYLFAPGSTIKPELWPCPRSSEGKGGCEKRFWSDAKQRRTYQENQRTFLKNRDTFACRFYHGLAMRSPCETTGTARRVRLDVVDAIGLPHKLKPFVITAGNAVRRGLTDDQGRIDVLIPEGDHSLEFPGYLYAHMPSNEQKYEFAKHDQYPELVLPEIDESVSPPRAFAENSLDAHIEDLAALAAYANGEKDT